MSRKEKVGRDHPPNNRRFGSGQKRSQGRPKGAIGEKAIVQKIAGELHEVRQKGQKTQVTTYELLLKSMRTLAMSTDLRAAKWLSDYMKGKLPEADDSVGFLVVPEPMPSAQFAERMMLRNRFATDPELKEDPVFRT